MAFHTRKKMTVHPGEFEFTVPESGDYYVTFTCTQVIDKVLTEDGLHIKGPMGMVGGFSVTEKNGSSIATTEKDTVKLTVKDRRIIVSGTDNYSISTLTGAKITDIKAQLPIGIYIVETKGTAHKILIR